MRFEEEIEEPKLLVFSKRFNKPELEGGCTPPPLYKATIPFGWEEAPGKPRSTITTAASEPPPQAVKSLNPPPRMFINPSMTTPTNGKSKLEMIQSPTSVLYGPYYGMRSLSVPKMVGGKRKWKIMMPLRKMVMCKETSSFRLSSWSWDGNSGGGHGGRDSSSSSFEDLSDSLESKIKINKVSKRRSLVLFIKTTSSILESMNQSINQAVPWRC